MTRQRLSTDHAALANDIRGKLFGSTAEFDALVSFDLDNIAYLTGYSSMIGDFERDWPCAVVATADRVALVTDCSDAAAGSEVLGYASDFFRYGRFIIEHASGFVSDVFDTFAGALSAALAEVAGRSARIGLDRNGLGARRGDLTADFDETGFVDATAFVAAARRTKLPGEISLIGYATSLVEQGIEAAFQAAGAGMTELEFSAILCREMVAGGGIPRLVAVTSGPRSAMVDAYASNRKLEAGDIIRLDIGCTVDGYWSDMARSAVVGEPSDDQARRYAALAAGLEAELAATKAGVRAGDLFDVAVATVRQHGLPHYRRHHCGHGIGRQIHEFPVLAAGNGALLEPGMVLCLETPYYELGWGGMMVEDTVVVRPDGFENLTSISRSLRILPA